MLSGPQAADVAGEYLTVVARSVGSDDINVGISDRGCFLLWTGVKSCFFSMKEGLCGARAEGR